MSWQKCPICEGRGNVPQGFYARQPSLPTTAPPLLEPCRSCDGKGVLQEAHALPTLGRDPMLVPYGPGFQPPIHVTVPPWTGDEVPPLPKTTCKAPA